MYLNRFWILIKNRIKAILESRFWRKKGSSLFRRFSMARNADGQAPHKWRGRWRAAITVGSNSKGKQKRKYCYGKTKEECLREWNKLKRQFDDGTLITEESMTLNQWFEHWLKVKEREISARTIEEYGYTLRHILPRIGRYKLDKLKPLHIQHMQLDIADEISVRQAVHSRNLVHNTLNDALQLGLVMRNVAAAVKPLKYEKPEFEIWSAEEVIRFMEFSKASRYYALYYTALTTGLRPGELIALHWADIEDDKLFVNHNISVVKNKPILGPPKTKRGKRLLHLPIDTLEVLERHKHDLQISQLDSKLVFPSKTGNFLQHGNLIRTLRLFTEKAEVTQIRMHDLRHTHASMRIANGTDIVRISRDLGHSNPSFTLDVYAHLFARIQQHDAASLSELIGIDSKEVLNHTSLEFLDT